MTEQIFKYPIPFSGEFELELPTGAKIIHVDTQTNIPDELCIWAIVDASALLETRLFFLLGTGHFLPRTDADLHHIGTVLVQNFVWHLFESTYEIDEE